MLLLVTLEVLLEEDQPLLLPFLLASLFQRPGTTCWSLVLLETPCCTFSPRERCWMCFWCKST